MSNGILPTIPGDIVSAATKLCPSPDLARDRVQRVEMEVPGYGLVAFTAELKKNNRGGPMFWTVLWADPVLLRK
jgi:hypothetical protein